MLSNAQSTELLHVLQLKPKDGWRFEADANKPLRIIAIPEIGLSGENTKQLSKESFEAMQVDPRSVFILLTL